MDNLDKLHANLEEAGWMYVSHFGKVGEIGYEEAWKNDEGFKVDLFSEAHLNGTYVLGMTIGGITYPCYSPQVSRPIHTWNKVSFPVPSPIEDYLIALYSTTWVIKNEEIWDIAPFNTENGRHGCEKKDMPLI